MRVGCFLLARCLSVAAVLSCSNPISKKLDATVTDAIAPPPDTLPVPDLRLPADASPGTDIVPGNRCAKLTVSPAQLPARGTVLGPKVEGEVCDNGVETGFFGPSDIDQKYDQAFFTKSWVDAPYSPTGRDMSQIYGFLMRKPVDALSANLSGSVGVGASAAGTYDSTSNCGRLDFEVTLPIPPDVICKTEFLPCDPGCEGQGELVICQPAHAKLRYSARSSAACGTPQVLPQGGWVLTVTSVLPYFPRENYVYYQTHGNLTATLVNNEDPSDSVVLNLDF